MHHSPSRYRPPRGAAKRGTSNASSRGRIRRPEEGPSAPGGRRTIDSVGSRVTRLRQQSGWSAADLSAPSARGRCAGGGTPPSPLAQRGGHPLRGAKRRAQPAPPVAEEGVAASGEAATRQVCGANAQPLAAEWCCSQWPRDSVAPARAPARPARIPARAAGGTTRATPWDMNATRSTMGRHTSHQWQSCATATTSDRRSCTLVTRQSQGSHEPYVACRYVDRQQFKV